MPINDYDTLFQSAAKAWNIDPILLKALTSQESAGNPNATSKAGAYGLTQIMPQTAQALGITDPTDPAQQIYGAAKYLNEALTKEPTADDALRYYHGGPNWRQAYGPESAGYAPAIGAKYAALAAAAQKANTPADPTHPSLATPAADDPFGQAVAAARTASGGVAPSSDPFGAAVSQAQAASDSQPQVANRDPFGSAVAEANKTIPTEAEKLAPAAGAAGGSPGTPGTGATMPGMGPGEAATIPEAAAAVGSGIAATGVAALQGAKEGFGSEPLGLSPEHEQWLIDNGVFNKPGEINPLKAANRALIGGGASLADLAARAGSALMRGGQAAVAEGGAQVGQPQLGRDIAAIPESLAGDAQMAVGGMHPPEPVAAAVGGAAPVINQFAHTPASMLSDNPGMAARGVANDVANNPLVRVPEAANAPAFVPPGSRIPEPAVNVGPRPDFLPPDNPLSPVSVQSKVANALNAVPTAPTEIEVNTAKEAAKAAYKPPPAAANAPGKTVPSLADVPAQIMTPEQSTKAPTASVADAETAEPGAVAGVSDRAAQVQRVAQEHAAVHAPALQGGDETQYVPGVRLSKADITGSADDAALMQSLAQTPGGNGPIRAFQNANNLAHQAVLDSVKGDATDTQGLIDARSAQAEQNLQAAFGNKKATDAAPVAQTMQSILTGARDSENTAVQTYIKPLMARLYDSDGVMKSDPEVLYGLREDIARMQGKAAKAETPTLDHVTGQLQQIKDSLDTVIEQGAPGYKKYLKDFSEASKPIDQQEFLQSYDGKLTNGSDRELSFPKVDGMMKNIVKLRAAKGINQAKSISPEAMDKLINLHASLKRQDHTTRLGTTKVGSPTSQYLTYTKKLAEGGLRMAIGAHTGLLSEVGLHVAKGVMGDRAIAKQLQNHLSPDVAKLVKKRGGPVVNPLSP